MSPWSSGRGLLRGVGSISQKDAYRNIVNAQKMLTIVIIEEVIAGCFINMLLNSAGDRGAAKGEPISKPCIKLKTGKRKREDTRGW